MITRRIAWLIATRRARPSEILALTFTDKAAAEMQVRVDQLVPYGYTDTTIATFHAFGDRLIREYALELGLPADVRVLSRAEVVIFLREHLFEFELDALPAARRPDPLPGRARDPVQPVQGRGRLARRRMPRYAGRARGSARPRGRARTMRARSREEARRQASSPGPTPATRSCSRRTAASISATRSRWRCGSCASRRGRAAEIQARFRYILVDEFQDTNRAQAELVALARRAATAT